MSELSLLSYLQGQENKRVIDGIDQSVYRELEKTYPIGVQSLTLNNLVVEGSAIKFREVDQKDNFSYYASGISYSSTEGYRMARIDGSMIEFNGEILLVGGWKYEKQVGYQNQYHDEIESCDAIMRVINLPTSGGGYSHAYVSAPAVQSAGATSHTHSEHSIARIRPGLAVLGGELFVIGNQGTGYSSYRNIQKTSDLLTWSSVSYSGISSTHLGSNFGTAFTFKNKIFLITQDRKVYSSTNGSNYTYLSTIPSAVGSSLYFARENCIVVGDYIYVFDYSDNPEMVRRTLDGITWEELGEPNLSAKTARKIYVGNGFILLTNATSQTSTNPIYISHDGVNWFLPASGGKLGARGDYSVMAYNGAALVFGGRLKSSSYNDWIYASGGKSFNIEDITSGDASFNISLSDSLSVWKELKVTGFTKTLASDLADTSNISANLYVTDMSDNVLKQINGVAQDSSIDLDDVTESQLKIKIEYTKSANPANIEFSEIKAWTKTTTIVDWQNMGFNTSAQVGTQHGQYTHQEIFGSGYIVGILSGTSVHWTMQIDGGDIFVIDNRTDTSAGIPLFPIRFNTSLLVASEYAPSASVNVWVVLD